MASDRPIVIVAEPGSENEAAVRLGRIGFDSLAGYLDGGMAALADHEQWGARFDRYAPETLRERLAQADTNADPPLFLDVRNAAELADGRIETSTHIAQRVATTPVGGPASTRDHGLLRRRLSIRDRG